MSTILLTGAAGFIGSHLSEKLVAAGYRVVGLDCFFDNYDPAVKRSNIATAMKHKSFTLLEADIRDAAALEAAFAAHHPEIVIHLAALAGVRPSVENPPLYMDVNLTGTARLLDAAVKHKVQRFVFGSSSSVYGNNSKVPFSESDRVDGPVSPYAMTKRSGELLCHAYHHIYKLPITCLRFFTVYGPRQRPDLAIHKFMKLIAAGKPITMFGDGSTSRDYTYIDDITAGITAAMERCTAYHIYNLGSKRPIGLLELIHAIEKAVGKPAKIIHEPMQPGDVEKTFADVTLSGAELGYAPSVTLEEGLARQWAWVKQQ